MFRFLQDYHQGEFCQKIIYKTLRKIVYNSRSLILRIVCCRSGTKVQSNLYLHWLMSGNRRFCTQMDFEYPQKLCCFLHTSMAYLFYSYQKVYKGLGLKICTGNFQRILLGKFSFRFIILSIITFYVNLKSKTFSSSHIIHRRKLLLISIIYRLLETECCCCCINLFVGKSYQPVNGVINKII